MPNILLDTCVWGGVKTFLEQKGYQVEWVGDWGSDPGDEEILAYAFKHQKILITLDKDFGELAIVYEKPHYGIIRLVNLSSSQQCQTSLSVLEKYISDLQNQAIITAESFRCRVRRP